MNKTHLKKSVSVAQALDMFDYIVEKLGVNFSHIEEGCRLRNTIMADYFVNQSVETKNIWMLKKEPRGESFKGDLFGKSFSWGYHVASVVDVDVYGKVKPMVYDPCFFDGPIGTKKWCNVVDSKHTIGASHIVDINLKPSDECFGTALPFVEAGKRFVDKAYIALEKSIDHANLDAGYFFRKVHPSPLRKLFNSKSQVFNQINNIKPSLQEVSI